MPLISRSRITAFGLGIVCAAMLMAPAPSWSAGPSPLRDVKVQNWTEDPSLDWIADAVRFYGLWYSDTFTVATGKTVVGEGEFDPGYTLYGGYYLDGDDISLGVTLWKGKTFLDDRHFSGSPEKAAEWLSGLGGFLADYLFPGEEDLKITVRPTSSTAALKSFLRAGEAADEAGRKALLDEALGEDSAFLEAAWKLGVLRLVGKEYGKALSHFAAYAAARPLHAGAFYNRALALLGLGRNEEALGIVENVALDRGKETATVLMLVMVYEASGLAEEAAAIRAGLPAEAADSRPMVFTSPYPGGLPASWMAEGPGAEAVGEASPLIKVAESGVESPAEKPASPAGNGSAKKPPSGTVPPTREGGEESTAAPEDQASGEKAALRREVEEYRKLTAELQESLQEIQQEAAKVAWEAMEGGDVEDESRKEMTSLKMEKELIAGKAAAGEEKVMVLQEKLDEREAELGELTRTVEALKAKESEKQAAGEMAGEFEDELRRIEVILEEVEKREQENAARIVTLIDELERERLRVKDLDGMLTEERARSGNVKTVGEEEVLRLKGEVEKLETKIAALQEEKKKEPVTEADPGKVEEELRKVEEVLEAVEGREQENAERIVALLDEFERERVRAEDLEKGLTEEQAKAGDLAEAVEKEKKRSEELVAEVLKERNRAKEFEARLKELRGRGAGAAPAAGQEDLAQEYEKRFSSLEKELGRKEKEVAGAASRITELEADLEELAGKLEAAEAEKAELTAAAAAPGAPLPAASAKWDDAEKTEYWEKRTRDLQQTIAELSRRESEMVAEVQIRDELVEELRRKATESGVPGDPAEQRSQAAQFEAKAAGMEAELQEERKRVEELTMSLASLNLEEGDVAEELKKKDELIAGYEKKVAELEAQEPDNADLDKKAKKRIAKLEKELKKAGEEGEKAAGKIEKLGLEKEKVELALEEEKKNRRGKVGEEKEKLEKESLAEREKIEEKHRAEIESLAKKQGAAIEDLVKKNAAAAEEAAARHVAALEKQATANAAATKELTGKYAVMLEEAEKKHASEKENLVKELAAEREKADRDLAEGARAAAGTVSGLEEKFAESEKKRLEFEERSAGLEKKLRLENEDLARKLAEEKGSRGRKIETEKEKLEKKFSGEIKDLEKKHAGEIEKFGKKLAGDSEKALGESGKKIASLEEALAEERAGRGEAIEQVGRLEGFLNEEIAKREEAQKEQGGIVDQLNGKISALEEDLSRSGKDEGRSAKRIEDLEGERNRLQEKLDKREQDLSTYYSRVDDLAESVATLEKDLFKSRRERVNALERVRELEAEKEKLSKGLRDREDIVKASGKDLAALEKELSKLRKSEEKGAAELAKLEKSRKELEEKLKAERKRAASLEKAAGKRGEDSDVLRDSLETMQKSLDLSLQRTADLERQMEELRALNRKLAEKLKEQTLELLELKVH